MTPPRIILALLIALGLTAALPRSVPAQDDGMLNEVIQRNGELLMQAEALVRETNSVKARAALDVARKLHESSMTLMNRGNRQMAGRTAREAREAIVRAIAMARQEAKLEEGAHRAMERARNRLEQARAALDEHAGNEPAARKLVDDARTQLDRSRDNMQQHMFESALRLANASADLSARALQLLRRDGTGPDRLPREIQRTEEVFARIQEGELSGQSRNLIAEAKELQRRARENARGDRPRIALEQTERARAMALRVLRSAGGGETRGAESVERALGFTDEVIERARNAVREHEGDAARRRVAAAEEAQETARLQLRRGELEAAMASTLRAREMATAAVRGGERPVDPATVRSTLERTDERLRAVRERLSGAEDAGARALLERADRRQQEAWEAFDNGQPRRALALTRVAMNLAGNALRKLEGS